jgi:hypothetical protein
MAGRTDELAVWRMHRAWDHVDRTAARGNERIQEIIEKSPRSYQEEGGLGLEEARGELGLRAASNG